MNIEKIDRISISVSDLNEASRFYSELLGTRFDNIEITGSQGVYVKAAISPLGLELVEQPEEGHNEHLRSIVFKVSDLQAIRQELATKGLSAVGEISIGELKEIIYVIRGVRMVFASYKESEDSHPAVKAANRSL